MTRVRFLLPLSAFLLGMLPAANEAGVQAVLTLNLYFTCENGTTTQGYKVYAVGDRPELGAWDPAKAIELKDSPYPKWTGKVAFKGAKIGDVVEWKCIVRHETNLTDVNRWQAGANNRATLAYLPEAQSTGAF